MKLMSDKQDGDDRTVRTGDKVALRKKHPCGSRNWEVTRIGADIGLKCLGCGRVILLPRHEFRVRLHEIVRVCEG